MADQNILKAQKYLNSMYGHRSEWVKIDEDGITGVKLCQGIIRAFQIENGVTPVTGNIGNVTLSKMRKLKNISKMNTTDKSNPNVCIIQCALFAKGYNAGGITGIYYTTGVNAVKQYQGEAGLPVTGIIDWKVWMGLVSINWFRKTSSGDKKIVKIQQQLNTDWSDIIGVGPCDGVVSRFTSYGIIAALQAAEGIYTEFMGSIDKTNLGKQTTAKFPSVLKQGKNGDYVKYNKLVQYGLYLNGYDPERFDGIFDSTTKSKVEDFQKFYALTDIGLVTLGEVNCSTMKSLLVSKGDTDRKAKACDCSTVLNKQQALDIKNAGYQVVGRYLTGKVKGERKFITFEEIENIKNAGLRVFPIYQDGGYTLNYFKNLKQGLIDGHTAIAAAKRIGVPSGTVIYFAVDFDCYAAQMTSFIVPYFKKLNLVFNSETNTKNYKIGIYAPRYICSYIGEKGLAEYSFVADMSSGYSCNLGYPIPKNWAFDQFFELNTDNGGKFPSSPSFDLDKVGYSGRDKGFTTFDKVTYMSPDQLEEKNGNVLGNVQRDQFIYNVLEPLGYLNKVVKANIVYEKEFLIAAVPTEACTIYVSTKISNSFTPDNEFKGKPIYIEVDNKGTLTTTCENQIDNLSTGIELNGDASKLLDGTIDSLKEVAVSVTTGKIGMKLGVSEDGYPVYTFVVTTDDILPDSDSVDDEMTVEISFKLVPAIPTESSQPKYKIDWNRVAEVSVSVAAIVILSLAFAGGTYLVAMQAFFVAQKILIPA